MEAFFQWSPLVVVLLFGVAVFLRSFELSSRRKIKTFTLNLRSAELGFILLCLAWISELVLQALGVRIPLDLAPIPVLKIAGLAVMSLSLVFYIWCLVSFGISWRIGIDRKAPGPLVTGGVFSLSRNPIFVSMDLLFLGAFLVVGTPTLAVFFVILAVGIDFQIRKEERFLSDHYGKAYAAYRERVPRYFGLPGRSRS